MTNSCDSEKETLNGRKMPKRIWLLTYRHDGDVCWSDDPNPEDAAEIESVEYVRADTILDNERIATPSNEALLREALEAARDFLANQRLPLTVKRLAVIAKIDAALNPPQHPHAASA